MLTDEEKSNWWNATPWNADLKTRVFAYAEFIERAVIASYEAKLRDQNEPVAWTNECELSYAQLTKANGELTTGAFWSNYDEGCDVPLFEPPAPIPEGWISIDDERKPRYGQHVAVLTTNVDDDPVAIMANYNGKKRFLSIGGKKVKPATHWMPLPKPPMAAARSGE